MRNNGLVDVPVLLLGILIVLVVLWDTFETIVMPKTVRRRLRLTGIFYQATWGIWSAIAKRMKFGPRRVAVLGAFGPLSLLLLMALWAALMVIGFGFIHYGAGSLTNAQGPATIYTNFYFSGTTFFTLGFGDVVAVGRAGRALAIVEAGSGFGFLAIIISYLPVLYQSFTQRENLIVLLDSKAGSDPSAGEMLRRHGEAGSMDQLTDLLKEWEVWSAQQLAAFLSFPILAYYRSQHDDQSWLCAMTAVLDVCAVIEGGFEGEFEWENRLVFQARSTFAMARHVVVDLAYLLNVPPTVKPKLRCTESDWSHLKVVLANVGIPLDKEGIAKVQERRDLYEPYVVSLAKELFFVLPALMPTPGSVDNWQTTAWDDRTHF